MSAPQISVIMCNYNYGHYIEQCFRGILRQTFKDFEIVLTDDGSTDSSRKIIAKYAAEDSRFKVVYFEKNQGLMAATEDVMKRAKGRYIFGQGTDDFTIDETLFQRTIDAFQSHPTSAGFFGIAGLYSAERNQLVSKIGSAPREGFITPDEVYPAFVRGKLFIPGSASIWRADYMREAGGFNYALGPQIDYYLNHALACKYGIIFSKLPMTCQRIYEKPINFGSKGTLWEVAARFAEVERLMREIAAPYPGVEEDWAMWRISAMIDAVYKSNGVSLRLN